MRAHGISVTVAVLAIAAASLSALAENKPEKKGDKKSVSATERKAPAAKTPTCPQGQFWNGRKCEDNRNKH